MKEHQPALNVADQIVNLKEKGLIFKDDDRAYEFLNDVSYFRLIKAYSLGLKDPNGRYRDNASFELIQELYLFNSDFRHLLFPQIEKVEVNLRCRLGNYFSKKYGVLGYLNPDNFFDIDRHNDFLEDIRREIAYNSNSPFVKNFHENYSGGQLPFYALLEVITFGTLSKLFQNLNPEDRKAVSKQYGVPYTYFESWIENISYVRNICAHYGRLYNAKLKKTPQLFEEYKKIGIHNYYIFSTLICMKHIMRRDYHWNQFVERIDVLFKDYPHVKKGLMGFPDNWKELLTQ